MDSVVEAPALAVLADPTRARIVQLIRDADGGRAMVSRLAEQLGLSRGALSARLSPLEDDGLITRTTDPDDRRRVHVELTAAGREAFDRHGQHEGRDEAALLDVLSDAEQRRLAEPLRDRGLAGEPRIISRAGGAELRDEHGVATENDAHREVRIVVADHLDGGETQSDGIRVVESLPVEPRHGLEIRDREDRQV